MAKHSADFTNITILDKRMQQVFLKGKLLPDRDAKVIIDDMQKDFPSRCLNSIISLKEKNGKLTAKFKNITGILETDTGFIIIFTRE